MGNPIVNQEKVKTVTKIISNFCVATRRHRFWIPQKTRDSQLSGTVTLFGTKLDKSRYELFTNNVESKKMSKPRERVHQREIPDEFKECECSDCGKGPRSTGWWRGGVFKGKKTAKDGKPICFCCFERRRQQESRVVANYVIRKFDFQIVVQPGRVAAFQSQDEGIDSAHHF